jgi:metal-responsive CopG/Arc/MetJ family transcriptional regulator
MDSSQARSKDGRRMISLRLEEDLVVWLDQFAKDSGLLGGRSEAIKMTVLSYRSRFPVADSQE